MLQEPLRFVHENAVIDIPPIIAHAAFVLYEMVERGQVEIGEHLAREVSYWETAVFLCRKQALSLRESVPLVRRAFENALFGWVVENHRAAEMPDKRGVLFMVVFLDERGQVFVQPFSVYAHEKTADVHLQNPA